jgi:hypothetical protein
MGIAIGGRSHICTILAPEAWFDYLSVAANEQQRMTKMGETLQNNSSSHYF